MSDGDRVQGQGPIAASAGVVSRAEMSASGAIHAAVYRLNWARSRRSASLPQSKFRFWRKSEAPHVRHGKEAVWKRFGVMAQATYDT